ncbi:MAG TPA: hypothetical protein VHS58_19710 [Acetobacteraceae bacterium]|jgi:hypothetical protein|nr:hypothetical protein [Acetobacteraceae bacterium]
MATLAEALTAIRNSAEGDGTKPGRIPPDILKVMHRVTEQQRASGYHDRMPKIGQPMPSFALPNQDGTTVASADLLAKGPLVVSFFRGRW